MQRRFLVGVVGGVAVVAALGGLVTHIAAGKNLQQTTVDRVADKLYVKVDGHPAVKNTILQARIQGWYHPLPWVGQEIRHVSCPTHLEAVVGASETCTAEAGGKKITIPVRTEKVTGKPEEPTVTWKFER